MPRKNVWKEVDSISFWELDSTELASFSAKLQRLSSKHPGARMRKQCYPYEDQEYISVQIEVPETDEQMHKREAEETKRREQQEARDRAEFARLNSKFGGQQ